MYRNEYLYFKSIHFFRKFCRIPGRSDPREGIIFHETGIPVQATGQICSLCAFNGEFPFLDDRMILFGKKVLVIWNPTPVIQNLQKRMTQSRLDFQHQRVEYIRPGKDGYRHIFQKHERYAYQQEYRLYIRSIGSSSIKLTVPNLKKVCDIVDAHHLCR
ncbi:MAG: hypothetical protein KDC80_08280 [Saprospiraceae bacterium]|nr:hypothetical protein [Saprospiraceae bacterium]